MFDDSDDKPSILIVDKTGQNRIFIDSKENKMEIEVQGDLTITVGGKLSITAKSGITVESSADISMKAQTNMSLEASGAFRRKRQHQGFARGQRPDGSQRSHGQCQRQRQ